MDKKWTLLGVICVISVIYSSLMYFSSTYRLRAMKDGREELTRTHNALVNESEMLRDEIKMMKSEDKIRALAWERLAMVSDREIIFYFTYREGQ